MNHQPALDDLEPTLDDDRFDDPGAGGPITICDRCQEPDTGSHRDLGNGAVYCPACLPQDEPPSKRHPACDHGEDLRLMIRPMWDALMASMHYPAQTNPPQVLFHRRGSGGGFSYDHQDKVTVSMVKSSLPRAMYVLLHELCHKAVGNRHRHNEVYNRGLRKAAETLWPGIDLGPSKSERGYALSKRLHIAMQTLDRTSLIALRRKLP